MHGVVNRVVTLTTHFRYLDLDGGPNSHYFSKEQHKRDARNHVS